MDQRVLKRLVDAVKSDEVFKVAVRLYDDDDEVSWKWRDPVAFISSGHQEFFAALTRCGISYDGFQFKRSGWFSNSYWRPEEITAVYCDSRYTEVYVNRIGRIRVARGPYEGSMYPATPWNIMWWFQAVVAHYGTQLLVRSHCWNLHARNLTPTAESTDWALLRVGAVLNPVLTPVETASLLSETRVSEAGLPRSLRNLKWAESGSGTHLVLHPYKLPAGRERVFTNAFAELLHYKAIDILGLDESVTLALAQQVVERLKIQERIDPGQLATRFPE